MKGVRLQNRAYDLDMIESCHRVATEPLSWNGCRGRLTGECTVRRTAGCRRVMTSFASCRKHSDRLGYWLMFQAWTRHRGAKTT